MDRYSRFVALLRVVLPLTALALLSTLFLLSRGVDTEAVIPFADTEIQDRTRSQQVTEPFFSGVTPNGNEIMVTATTARPGIASGLAAAEDLSAVIRTPEGTEITMVSDRGTFDLREQMASFLGNVVIKNTWGYTVKTAILNSSMSNVQASTPGEVTGTGPIGDFTAGRMILNTEKGSSDTHFFFTNGVKLIYDPKNAER